MLKKNGGVFEIGIAARLGSAVSNGLRNAMAAPSVDATRDNRGSRGAKISLSVYYDLAQTPLSPPWL